MSPLLPNLMQILLFMKLWVSRKPKECVNGYDIIIAMQKWQLERGYFLHQSDGNNCGPIACMKIMELFHAINVEEACKVYEKKNIC
jgi:hypothetical protein